MEMEGGLEWGQELSKADPYVIEKPLQTHLISFQNSDDLKCRDLEKSSFQLEEISNSLGHGSIEPIQWNSLPDLMALRLLSGISSYIDRSFLFSLHSVLIPSPPLVFSEMTFPHLT